MYLGTRVCSQCRTVTRNSDIENQCHAQIQLFHKQSAEVLSVNVLIIIQYKARWLALNLASLVHVTDSKRFEERPFRNNVPVNFYIP